MSTKKLQCPYHGGTVIRLTMDMAFCIPNKYYYTGTNGHEIEVPKIFRGRINES